MDTIHLFAARWGKVGAYRLLAAAAAQVWALEVPSAMEHSDTGKPYFPDHPQYQFSLSHTGDLCFCALSSCPVGVDAELVRPHRPGLPRKVMNDAELELFDGSWEDFTRIWTLKEAYCKYLGRSFWPPKQFPVPPPVPHRSYVGDGWRAAVCGEEALPETVCWLE